MFYPLEEWVSISGNFFYPPIYQPWRHLEISGDIFWLSPLGRDCYWHLAQRGQGCGLLLNILQCIGQPSLNKKFISQNVNSAKFKKPYSGMLWKLIGKPWEA